MASYPKIRSYTDNAFPATFNINDFTTYSGYATLGDLLSYANIYNSNMFYSTNYFTSIYFTDYINGITPQILNYVYKLTNYFYDTNTGDSAINSNVAISGSLAIPTINTNSILSVDIECNNLICNNLIQPNKSTISSNANSFILNNSNMYPLLESSSVPSTGLISNLTGINLSLPLYITIAPKTTFYLFDVNNVMLYSLSNTTSDYTYYNLINYNQFFTPYKFTINST